MILTLKRFQVMLAYQMRLSSTKNAFMLAVNEWVNVCRILFTFINVIIIWRLKPFSLHLGQNHPFHIYPKIELAIEEIGLNQQIRTLKQKKRCVWKIRLFSHGDDEKRNAVGKKDQNIMKATTQWDE